MIIRITIIQMLLKNPCLLHIVHIAQVKGCLFSKNIFAMKHIAPIHIIRAAKGF